MDMAIRSSNFEELLVLYNAKIPRIWMQHIIMLDFQKVSKQ